MADYDPRTDTGIPTEPVGSLPRPAKLQEAYAKFDAGEIERVRPPGAAGRGGQGLRAALGGHGRADRLRRRAALVELRHLPDRHDAGGHRPRADARAGRAVLRDLRRRARAAAAQAGERPVRLQPVRGRRPAQVHRLRDEADEAGRHRAVDARAAVPAEGPGGGLQPRGLRGQADRRVREGHPRGVRGGGGAGVGGLHRGPPGHPGGPAEPVDGRGAAAALHRAEQPRDGPVHRRGAQEHRHPHLPRRRPRLRALRRRALQQPAGLDVRHQRRLLPHPDEERARQGPGAARRSARTCARTPTG